MQEKIINLVGPSGSGKTTIAKELEKMGYNIILSYTTREPREPNEWGHTFVSEGYMSKDFILEVGFSDSKYKPKDNVIAYKEVYEGCHYWTTKEQYQGKGTSIYVVDPDGVKQVHENVKDADIVTIFLNADKEYRYHRMLQRGNLRPSLSNTSEEIKQIEGIRTRLYKDDVIFKVCKCDYTVDANREVKEVLEDVVKIIKGDDEN